MRKEIIYTMNTAYRGEYSIKGFSFGTGEKAACIMGAMRGNEFQQLYICSLLSKKLSELETRIKSALKSQLGLATCIRLVAPNSLRRFEGKAKRVTDLRKDGL